MNASIRIGKINLKKQLFLDRFLPGSEYELGSPLLKRLIISNLINSTEEKIKLL